MQQSEIRELLVARGKSPGFRLRLHPGYLLSGGFRPFADNQEIEMQPFGTLVTAGRKSHRRLPTIASFIPLRSKNSRTSEGASLFKPINPATFYKTDFWLQVAFSSSTYGMVLYRNLLPG
jgi:hypothetical protein